MGHLLKLATTLLQCIPAFFRSRYKQALVELALRQQLATYTQKGPKPRITAADRAFWVFLSQVWSRWKEILVVVQPETAVRWHRKGFRLYWRSISKRGPGRPPIPVEVHALIRRFANENGWRARKIRAELEKLGISERWVGSARRELLDHVIVLNERHLQRLLREYVDYYNNDRVHTELQDSPLVRPTEHRPTPEARVVGLPRGIGI